MVLPQLFLATLFILNAVRSCLVSSFTPPLVLASSRIRRETVPVERTKCSLIPQPLGQCHRLTRRGVSVLDETAKSSSEISEECEQEEEEEKKRQQDPFLERLHDDMRQVLQSRRSQLEPLLERSRNRQRRPVVLEEDLDGAQRVYIMLQHLIQVQKVTFESFEIVLEALVRRDRMRWQQQDSSSSSSSRRDVASATTTSFVCAADLAEDLFEQLVETALPKMQLQNPKRKMLIPVSTYSLVLQCYANCATPRGSKHYADRAMQLYQDLETNHGETPQALVHVLHAYAWEQANLQTAPVDGQELSAAQQAQVLLEERIENHVDDVTRLQCYDWVLEAWSKSGSLGSAEKAHKLFEKMKALNETMHTTFNGGSSSVGILDAETYSNIILAWSKCSSSGSTQRAEDLLVEMIDKYRAGAFERDSSSYNSLSTEPPLIAFNGVITAWGRARRPDHAERVLQLMQDLRPSCRMLVPDAVSYNSVLYAYLRSSHLPPSQVLDKVLNLVQYMKANCKNQPAIQPNSFTYTTLLKCWIQSGRDDLAEQAEAVLKKIERAWSRGDRSIQPNNRVFNMVINAYAKSSGYRLPAAAASARTLDILKRMKEYPLRQCQPDNISYTSVLECLSKSDDPRAPQQAQALLDEITQRYEQTHDPAHMPNLRTFTMTILTFAKNHGSVVEARNLLTRLVNWYEVTRDPQLRPSEYPYNYVLNCAANSPLSLTSPASSSSSSDDASAADDQDSVRQRAFAIATETYQEMRKSSIVKPDSYTYAFWLKCCNNLIPNGDLRCRCISYAFEECRKNGLVTNEVLTRLFQGSPPQVVDELLELSSSTGSTIKGSPTINYRSLTVNDLPPSWSRNSQPRKR